MPAVWAVSVKVSREMAGENPENPDPDGNMQHTVIVLVSFTLNDFFHVGLNFNMREDSPQRTRRTQKENRDLPRIYADDRGFKNKTLPRMNTDNTDFKQHEKLEPQSAKSTLEKRTLI